MHSLTSPRTHRVDCLAIIALIEEVNGKERYLAALTVACLPYRRYIVLLSYYGFTGGPARRPDRVVSAASALIIPSL
jgi:hypothetical protein